MHSLRHPGRRAFLGFIGALLGAPGAVRAFRAFFDRQGPPEDLDWRVLDL
ncbi:hypothetical protein [Haloferula sp. A504]|nr:hypothetical protein [Verrucomicrobiaceae bacterium E54]